MCEHIYASKIIEICNKPYEWINGALYVVQGTDANTVDCVSQSGRQWSYIHSLNIRLKVNWDQCWGLISELSVPLLN